MVLFLDTSNQIFTLGLINNNEVVYEEKIALNNNLSIHLMPAIKEALDETNITANDINKIIVTAGPGSFTGLRLGLTVAKTWAFTKSIEVIPISSLKTIASTSNEDYIIPIIDARREHVFSAIYDKNLNPILKDQYISLDNLKNEISKLDKGYIIVTNDSYDFDTIPSNINLDKLIKHINELPVNPHTLNPEYLKQTEAEARMGECKS